MTEPLKALELPIKKVFFPDFAFTIPVYQRPYSWTTEQVYELFNDLTNVLDTSNMSTRMDDIQPYFLGSIVLIKESGRPDADVVDGQQRLTTLTILLAILRDHAEDQQESNAIQNVIFQHGTPVTGDPDRFRLILRRRDAGFFQRVIQERDGTALLEADPGDLTDSQANIRNNALELKARVAALSAKERSRLAAYVIQRCYLVIVSASDRDAAYRIFAVTNDRGLDLSATDILKADIIGQFRDRPADEKKFTEIWEDLEDNLGRKSFEDLFGHIRMIFIKQKASKTSYKNSEMVF